MAPTVRDSESQSRHLQRLCAKTMAILTRVDLNDECSANQLCAGTKAGVEGAVHGISQLFENNNCEGVLLMDASNAFNALSRPLALWNARIHWPRCARFLHNTYKGYPMIIFRQSEKVILSQEGTTQGDPLGMYMYAVGTLPLVRKLSHPRWKQNWYADDAACGGRLDNIKIWLERLKEEGPKCGYFPEPEKSFLVVRPGMETRAAEVFQGTGLKIALSHRFLGGFLGSANENSRYVKEKVDTWTKYVNSFANVQQGVPRQFTWLSQNHFKRSGVFFIGW
uniref:Reverse transcriptase domain-containing protein n=1 Tax=Lygus hesperus TaxID=30085 RepID=A0A0A9WIR6_LYGHE